MKQINWEKLAQITTVLGFFLIFITVVIGIIQIQGIKKQLSDANEIASLQNVLALNSQLYTIQNTAILAAIGNKKPILKENHGSVSDYELENFLGIFDSMNQAYTQGHVSNNDLCEQFNYYIKTSFEYPEIQMYLKKIRNEDSSYFRGFDNLYNIIGKGNCNNY